MDNRTLQRIHEVPPGVDRLDWAEAVIVACGGQVQGPGEMIDFLPLEHRFTPGLYSRTIFMPAGSVITSKIHLTEHQYVVTQGVLSVYSDNDGPQIIRAPFMGITKPGTRRLLFIHEDTLWTTFHATDLTDVEAIERTILEPHKNPLLEDGLVAKMLGEGQ